MDLQQAKINMLKQQIHTWNVFDHDLIDLIATTPRDSFVPEQYRDFAYADMAIPLAHGQQMLTPKEEARLLQELQIKATDFILEVGTGTGYLTALLAKLGEHVYSIDIEEDFTQAAESKLRQQGLENITMVNADAAKGWQNNAPYDVIVVTASYPIFPETLIDDLNIKGRLFCIVGTEPMTAMLITRESRHQWRQQTLFETMTPALLHAAQPDEFVF